MNAKYIGRFAPSPTGPLHFGSLLAATASYLDAKSHQGKWLVRMEDVDRQREVAGAAAQILSTLEAFGFEWDGAVLYQSKRDEAYQAALETLKQAELAYPCGCSRKEITETAHFGSYGPIYPGVCRDGLPAGKQARAWRIKTDSHKVIFADRIQGQQLFNLAEMSGDFIIKRADDLFAYQLAVVVDDAMQGITHIVRGADLLDSTPRQIHLQQQLGFSQPSYAHIPVAVNQQGEKLSKQTHAEAIAPAQKITLLKQAFAFLGLTPPSEAMSLDELWQFAIVNWNIGQVPNKADSPYTNNLHKH
jgi:glutamyl-Q tRNA(Asp) synthetase